MTSGVYKRTDKERARLRKMIRDIGYVPPKGTRMAIGTEFKKGIVPWNKGITWPEMSGDNNPNKRPEVREKVSRTRKANAHQHHPRRGEDHWNWKGGKTPLVMQIRNSPQCADWHRAVFERDKYTCRVCGDDRGHNLNAHHYRQLADMVHSLGIESFLQAVETPILWDISNGVTLCEDCHVMANAASKLVKFLYGGDYEQRNASVRDGRGYSGEQATGAGA